MKLILKIIILQVFWYFAVVYGPEHELTAIIVAYLIVMADIAINKRDELGKHVFALAFFVIYGAVQDGLANYLKLVRTDSLLPIWLNSLWVVFIAYYGDVFNKFAKLKVYVLSAIGALGGVLAFYSGAKLSPGLEVINHYYYSYIALSWGLFFPLSLKIYYEGFIWNKLLDISIYYSFDLDGFKRHQKNWKNFDEQLVFSKSSALITGGTSGIGLETARVLKENGIKCFVTGRSERKGESAKAQGLEFIQCDMSDWNQVKKLSQSVGEIDYLVLNAGGMPDAFEKNAQGIESQFASQLMGHYLLLKLLYKSNSLSKVVWVTSGGMYLRKLDLKSIFEDPNYDKVATYANVKRAQVTLLPKLKEEFSSTVVNAMHPGWVNTPGVQTAIPGFFDKMQTRLRTPRQGADTILWLLSDSSVNTSGNLYFDRKKVKTHFFWFTKASDKKADELFNIVNDSIAKG